jgi:hypothetical protein
MKNAIGIIVVAALSLASASCMTYTGVSKGDGQQIYISGGMTYVVITIPFIKRCDVDGNQLRCEELKELPEGSRGGGGAPAAPAAPAAPTAPAAPAKK